MPGFVVDQQTTLLMAEKVKITPGDVFTVTTHDGTEIFRLQGPLISMTGKKTLVDVRQNLNLYSVGEPVSLSAHDIRRIDDCETGQHVLTIEKKLLNIGHHTAHIWYGGHASGAPMLTVEGGIREKEFDIKSYQTGEVLARIRHKTFNFRHLLGADTYAVTVEAGQDAALVICIALCVDEMFIDE